MSYWAMFKFSLKFLLLKEPRWVIQIIECLSYQVCESTALSFFFLYAAIVVNNPLDVESTYFYFQIGYLDGDTQVISAWSNPLTTQPAMGVGMCISAVLAVWFFI